MTHDFNVRSLPWIRVTSDAGIETLGLEELLVRAHQITDLSHNGLDRSALLRFLTATTALVAREHGVTAVTAGQVSRDGFDPAVVKTVLDRIDAHLHLIHPTTPFMQDGRLADVTAALASRVTEDPDPVEETDDETDDECAFTVGAKPAAALRVEAAGASSKAWWGRLGTEFFPDQLTPADAAVQLLVNWFHGAQSNDRVAYFQSQRRHRRNGVEERRQPVLVDRQQHPPYPVREPPRIVADRRHRTCVAHPRVEVADAGHTR